MFTQEKRLKVIAEDFYVDPIKTIQSFIGIDSDIIEYNVNNIYFDDCLIVDVKFKRLELDPTKVYWTQFKNCKLLNIKLSGTYITKIENINVCVIIRQQYEPNDWIPLIIDITIPNNREESYFKYFGKIIDSPFHECNSQIFNYDHAPITEDINKYNEDTVLFEDSVIQKSYDKINNIFAYKATVQAITTQELTKINDLSEANDKNKLYLIDIRKIKNIENHKGFIACSKYREKPWDVLFINIPNYNLTEKKLEYLKWFMLNDYHNYIEWLSKISK